jgi:hypothetical protein
MFLLSLIPQIRKALDEKDENQLTNIFTQEWQDQFFILGTTLIMKVKKTDEREYFVNFYSNKETVQLVSKVVPRVTSYICGSSSSTAIFPNDYKPKTLQDLFYSWRSM